MRLADWLAGYGFVVLYMVIPGSALGVAIHLKSPIAIAVAAIVALVFVVKGVKELNRVSR